MDYEKKIDIPFGAKDSELKGWEYTIPDGMEAEIKDGKVIVREKENEDERIRKEIIRYIVYNANGVSDKQEYAWITYLERQKEQPNRSTLIKRAHTAQQAVLLTESDGHSELTCVTKSKEDAVILIEKGLAFFRRQNKQKPLSTEENERNSLAEQKPVQDREEREYVRTLKSLIVDFLRDKECVNRGYYQDIYDWLDGRHIEQQPKQEWSEEDEKALKIVTDVFKEAGVHLIHYPAILTWLKSISERFNLQPKQEWSEEYREEDLRTRFAFYTYKDEDGILYLSNVFVEETSRNKGFGTKILVAAEKVAETIGAISIRLKAKQNSPANAWYRKHGYGYMASEDGYDWLEKTLEYLKPVKQEWSEEDEEMLVGIIERGSAQIPPHEPALREEQMEWLMNRLKSLRPQPKQEWSEEDAKMFADISWAIRYCSYDDKKKERLDDYLKTLYLHLRPQPHWKPSEEQMRAVFDASERNDKLGFVLSTLYNDLKKL